MHKPNLLAFAFRTRADLPHLFLPGSPHVPLRALRTYAHVAFPFACPTCISTSHAHGFDYERDDDADDINDEDDDDVDGGDNEDADDNGDNESDDSDGGGDAGADDIISCTAAPRQL